MNCSIFYFNSLKKTAAACLTVMLAGVSSQALACLPFPGHIRVGADKTHCQANDIQTAIGMAGTCPVVIDITREHTYTNQQLAIDGKYITFQGWGDGVTCADIPDELAFPPYAPPDSNVPLVTLDSGSHGRVLTITGNSNVGLHNLTISGGLTDDDASGGGISFDGQGTLYLIKSQVIRNQGGYGGGINMNGSSGLASLFVEDYSQVWFNTAVVSGGGIRIEGNSRLYASRPYTMIGHNQADGNYGGGLEVLGPARADIGSPGYGGLPVVSGNSAPYGGGISVNAQFGPAVVRLFTTDPTTAVSVSDNNASTTGGGIFLQSSSGYTATACLFDTRVDDNVAPDSAAIEAQGNLLVNPSDSCGPEPASTLGAVACAAGVPCNEISYNSTIDDNEMPTAGAVVNIYNTMLADRLHMQHNHGGELIKGGEFAVTYANTFDLSNCLIADNVLVNEAIFLGVLDFSVDRCTVVNNALGGGAAIMRIASGNPVLLSNSIFDQPNHFSIDYYGISSVAANYILSNDLTNLFGQGAGVLQGAPTYVDAANGDYHLQVDSLGVDYAPTQQGVDLDGKYRTVDLPGVPDQYGAMDLGAYEIQLTAVLACAVPDTIFCDPFGALEN